MNVMQRPLLLGVDRPSTLIGLREHSAPASSDGFDGIEWMHPTGPLLLQHGSSPVPHDDTLRIRALGIRCETVDIPSVVETVSSQLRAAASLGARVLNVGIPPVQQGCPGRGFARYQEGLNFAYELLHRARREAEATGVAVALEAADGGCLLSPVELREIIDVANSWAVGACIDAARIALFGSPADWVRTLQHRVQAVRLSPSLDEPKHGAAGGGACAEELIRSLDNVPPDRPLIVCGEEAGQWASRHIRHSVAMHEAQGTDSVCRQRD
jgi:sugar phosphate isomerase/epimerase